MQDSFISLLDCLNYWEFCPLCKKRLCCVVDDKVRMHRTIIGNTNLQVIDHLDNELLNVCFKTNSAIKNSIKSDLNLFLSCKNFHLQAIYKIEIVSDRTIELTARGLSFQIRDRKKNLTYYVRSNYETGRTDVNLEPDGSGVSSQLSDELMHFASLDKKHLIKTIRAYCLLG